MPRRNRDLLDEIIGISPEAFERAARAVLENGGVPDAFLAPDGVMSVKPPERKPMPHMMIYDHGMDAESRSWRFSAHFYRYADKRPDDPVKIVGYQVSSGAFMEMRVGDFKTMVAERFHDEFLNWCDQDDVFWVERDGYKYYVGPMSMDTVRFADHKWTPKT